MNWFARDSHRTRIEPDNFTYYLEPIAILAIGSASPVASGALGASEERQNGRGFTLHALEPFQS